MWFLFYSMRDMPPLQHAFAVVFSPSLLLIGHWWEVALSIITAVIGAILLGVALVGYLFRPVGVIKRILFLLAAAGLLIPIVHSGKFAVLTWASNSIGLALAILLLSAEWLARSSRAPRADCNRRSRRLNQWFKGVIAEAHLPQLEF